ncbi:DUF2855 family protein [Nocardioides sp.]|uniref:DUF2855 family protein n=1 Tax=Nocardioides sp. TaxID=35761 RepID=UPI002C45C4D2|nr:DUF2855 family protein [Nocardioides sp.]HXH81077.1 DUF2855 family protein [Nocardioides sp.]
MNLPRAFTLQTDRADIAQTRWHESEPAPLEPGQVRLRVDHFGLSANNVTYATLGDAMNYWDFFPQADPAFGCIPVWGYAAVSESRHPELPEGRRVYGFLPFASEVVMTPTSVNEGGFTDGSGHRSALPAPYNRYMTVAGEPQDGLADEAYSALLRPLFTTSFLIADWLAQESWFGAETVLISSASSKTAYGIAYALGNGTEGQRPEIVGLTSPAHVESTCRLGLYDRVLGYDEIDTLDPDRTVVYVDLSGSADVRADVHTRCAGLQHDCAVGLTHWDAAPTSSESGPLPGPDPVFFFAPAQLERQAAKEGRGELMRRISEAMQGFVTRVGDPSAPLMTVTWHRGRDAAAAAYLNTVAGRTAPSEGAMVLLSEN